MAKDRFGAKERKSSRTPKTWAGAEKPSRYGAAPKKGRGARAWGGKPAKAEKKRSQRQGWLAKIMPRSSQVTLRQYYGRMDQVEADAARDKLSRKLAGDQRDLLDLIRSVTGKPVSGVAADRVRRWLEDRADQMGKTAEGVQDLLETVLAVFRPRA